MISLVGVVFSSPWSIITMCSSALGKKSSYCCWMQLQSIQLILFLMILETVECHAFCRLLDAGRVFTIQTFHTLFDFVRTIKGQWPTYLLPLKNGNIYVPFGLCLTFGELKRLDTYDHAVLYSLQYDVALLLAMYTSCGKNLWSYLIIASISMLKISVLGGQYVE